MTRSLREAGVEVVELAGVQPNPRLSLVHEGIRLCREKKIGVILAVVFPAWMKHVYRNDVARFARFAAQVWDVEPSFHDPERTALEGIARLEAFFRGIGLKTRLGELGIHADRFEEMAGKCTERGPVGQFAKLGFQDVLAVYRLAE